MTLKTEQNTPKMGARVLSAAKEFFQRTDLQPDFEHGQWWITCVSNGAQWSVCDSEGDRDTTIDGFCFEQVTYGDEDESSQPENRVPKGWDSVGGDK